MLRDSLPIHVDRRGKRDRSTSIFPTGLLNHDGSRRKGELLTNAGAHIHKVGGSGFYTEKVVNILSFINPSIYFILYLNTPIESLMQLLG